MASKLPTNLERRGDKFYFRAVIGGKLYRRTTGFRDLQRAKRRASEIEGDIRAGKLGWERKDVPTFGMWMARFLKAFYPGKPTEEWAVSHALTAWATRPLNLITPTDVQEFFRGREAQGAANGSMARERVVLKRAFKAAIADKIIDTNPFNGMRALKCNAKTRVLSSAEEVQLRAAMSPMFDRYLTVALGTGLRSGEQRHLRPMDLRQDGTWVWVRPESNKLHKAREVPLSAAVQQALAEQAASRPGDSTTEYWPIREGAAHDYLVYLCRRLKMPRVTPHDFRRTFATRAAEKGMWPKHLQMILGHENITMTMRFYVALEQASLRDALIKAGL